MEKILELSTESYYGNWNKVLNMAQKAQIKNKLATYYANIAMSKLGIMGDNIMEFHQPFSSALFLETSPESNRISLFFSSDTYYHIGDLNMSQHAAMLGMIFSPNNRSSRLVYRLAEINITSGDIPAAMKYIRMLDATLFYKNKAERLKDMALNPQNYHDLQKKKSMIHSDDIIHNINDQQSSLILLLKNNPDNIAAFDYLLAYYLLNKDIPAFFKAFTTFYKEKNYLPKAYSEALLIYLAATNANADKVKEYKIPPVVLEEFKKYTFLYENENENIDLISKNFKNTYWFYYHYATINGQNNSANYYSHPNYNFNILSQQKHFYNEIEYNHNDDDLPPIYPDYTNIVIPCNIAPLNFLLRNNPEFIEIEIKGKIKTIHLKGKDKIIFHEKIWKSLMEAENGNDINLYLKAKINNRLIEYKPFKWTISPHKIDPYLTYRLIEPGYEVWNKIQLRERCMENFSERIIADNNLTENTCMNCHIQSGNNPDLSFFHIRGKNGGMIFNNNSKLQKINTKINNMYSPAIYGDLHKSGKYGIFSSNIVIPEFHTLIENKLEVYDHDSDLFLIDFSKNEIVNSPAISRKDMYETFPVFSHDGRHIYYCSAPSKSLPDSLFNLKYNLYSIDFNPDNGNVGMNLDTLINSEIINKSVSFPRPSPDGRYILYCLSEYGTFPIWHRETDIQMLDLKNGNIIDLQEVNSSYSDTYHSWSSNSRWFVFASKRDDGIYGKPYFSFINENGNVTKPFLLPQQDPQYYDYTLKSFNIPELSTGKLPFNSSDIEKLYWNNEYQQLK
jgi:hypothetical protein